MTKICLTADLHNHLPTIPEVDLLIIAGDICHATGPFWQAKFLNEEFRAWLDKIPAKEVVACAGNHCFVFEQTPHLVPKLRWHYLQDQVIELFGLKIYGSPWQLRFGDWAFNADEPDLERKYKYIPDDTNIIVSHGPPHGWGDFVNNSHVGSTSLRDRILQIKPILVVCGHIHCARGIYPINNKTTLINAALVDQNYDLTHSPIIVEIIDKKLTIKE